MPRRHRLRQLLVRLAGPGEADRVRAHARGQRDAELAAGRHVQAVDERREMPHHLRHRIGLDRVVQMHSSGQVPAQQLDALRDQAAVVSVERRAADAPRELGQRQAADLQAVVDDREVGERRVRDLRVGHRS